MKKNIKFLQKFSDIKDLFLHSFSRFILFAVLNILFVALNDLVSNVAVYAQNKNDKYRTEKNILTVRDAIRLAYEKNPFLNQSKLMLDISIDEKWIDWGVPPARLSFAKEGILSSSGKGFAEKRWMLTQDFDNPLKIYYRFKAGQKGVLASQSQYREAELTVRKQVKSAYADLAYSIQMVELQKQIVDLIKNFYHTAQIRYETGESSLMDLLKAEIDLAEADNDLEDAMDEFHKKRYALFTVIGIDAEDQNYEIQFPDTLRFVDIPVDQDTALNRVQRMPALSSIAYAYENALARKKEAWSGLLPDISFSVYRQNFGTGYHHHGFEIGLSFPIGFMLENRAKIAIAGNNASSLQWSRKGKELELKMNIENAWHRYDAVRRSLHRFQKTIGDKSEQLYRLSDEAYRSGQTDILGLLEARRTFINNRKKYFDLLHEYYLCLIDLEQYFEKDFVFVYEESP